MPRKEAGRRTKRSEPRSIEANPVDVRLLEPTVKIVAAYLSNNQTPSADITGLINSLHAAFSNIIDDTGEVKVRATANAIKRSVSDDYIICLEDGKKLRTLKRYLHRRYQMTPEQYRAKWGLPYDYPMVAPTYAQLRSKFAKAIGLGRKQKSKK